MNQETDQQLIEKTLKGHTASFGALVVRYQDFIFTIVVRMVKRKEEAEEVAQDSFIKAFERLESFQGKSKFSSWLYSIAYRTALDYLRKAKRFQNNVAVEEMNDLEVATLENGLQKLVAKERSNIIQECIMKLPEVDAAIITFYYFEELPIREIAGITEQTEDNIKIKLYRSRKKLYSLLAPFVNNKATTHGRAI
jgi:RNA polymerase sigma factor (sigma-70 family)